MRGEESRSDEHHADVGLGRLPKVAELMGRAACPPRTGYRAMGASVRQASGFCIWLPAKYRCGKQRPFPFRT